MIIYACRVPFHEEKNWFSLTHTVHKYLFQECVYPTTETVSFPTKVIFLSFCLFVDYLYLGVGGGGVPSQ